MISYFKTPKTEYKVWHIPQVPGKPFEIFCETFEEAVNIVRVLSEYDKFQFENKIKPDYANMSGLDQWDDEDEEWYSWELEIDDEYFDNIWDYIRYDLGAKG